MRTLMSIVRYFFRRRQGYYKLDMELPTIIGRTVTFSYPERIRIEKYVRIGTHCHLDGEGGLEILEGATLASRVVILTSSHVYEQDDYIPFNQYDMLEKVVVGRGSWICWGAKIIPGINIGDGAIVATGAVVTKDVPPGAMVGGNPAYLIKNRDPQWVERMIKEQRYYQKAVLEGSVIRQR